jgi:hypothetical protein
MQNTKADELTQRAAFDGPFTAPTRAEVVAELALRDSLINAYRDFVKSRSR